MLSNRQALEMSARPSESPFRASSLYNPLSHLLTQHLMGEGESPFWISHIIAMTCVETLVCIEVYPCVRDDDNFDIIENIGQ